MSKTFRDVFVSVIADCKQREQKKKALLKQLYIYRSAKGDIVRHFNVHVANDNANVIPGCN